MMKMSLKLAIGFLMLGLVCGYSSLEEFKTLEFLQVSLKNIINEYFEKYNCTKEMVDCKSQNLYVAADSECDRTKTLGRCFFHECPAIGNTIDAVRAAIFMIRLAKTENCEVAYGWFLPRSNGSIQIHQAPVWKSLATILIIVMIMKMFEYE